MLAERGYAVDIYAEARFWGDIHFEDPRIQVTAFSDVHPKPAVVTQSHSPSLTTRAKSAFRSIIPARLLSSTQAQRDVIYGLWRRVQRAYRDAWTVRVATFAHRTWRACRGRHYTCFVGIEPEGLAVATLLGLLRCVPTLYYDMELRFASDAPVVGNPLSRALLRWCVRRASLSVVPDADRANVLAQGTGVPHERIVCVPVAPRGQPRFERSDLLRQRLGISLAKRIILYAGSIADWSLCAELATAARSWPEEWVLVLHGYVPVPAYLDQLRALELNGRVMLSLEPVEYAELDRLVSSADIGIALYRNLGQNIYYIGSASGKVAQYLKCGLPVVTVDFPSMRRVVDSYQCGVCVLDATQVGRAIRQILADYETFRANAFRCYQEHYRFDRHFDKVLAQIDRF